LALQTEGLGGMSDAAYQLCSKRHCTQYMSLPWP